MSDKPRNPKPAPDAPVGTPKKTWAEKPGWFRGARIRAKIPTKR